MKHHESQADWIEAFYESALRWQGENRYSAEDLRERLEMIREYGNPYDMRLLELGGGTEETASYLCDQGYSVTAVDICRKNAELMHARSLKKPSLRIIESDFWEATIEEKFPTICMFESFGLGSDKEQRELLKRIKKNWLQAGGVLIVEVCHPCGPIRTAGQQRVLARPGNAPGSSDMKGYSYYDGIRNRWIDIWEPVAGKGSARIQSVRCYSPADLLLLVDRTGMTVEKILHKGQEIDFENEEIRNENVFEEDGRNSVYTAILKGGMRKIPNPRHQERPPHEKRLSGNRGWSLE